MASALREAAVAAALTPDRLDEWTLSITHKVSPPLTAPPPFMTDCLVVDL